MKKVKWNKMKRLPPGDGIPFFRENKDRYVELKRGNAIKVPNDLAELLENFGVESTNENPVEKKEEVLVIEEDKTCKTCY